MKSKFLFLSFLTFLLLFTNSSFGKDDFFSKCSGKAKVANSNLAVFNLFVSADEEYETQIGSGSQGGNFNLFDSIFSHMHNKLVHFPIALLVLAYILSLAQLRWNKFLFTIQVLIVAGFVFAIPTVITGLFQEELVESATKENFVEIHEKLAIATTFLSAVWFLFVAKNNLQKYHLIVGTITFILILITGFLGGLVAH
ncbi:MAG: hypothetical protein CH6_2279 [Candidatus Kapaibacterium sp.]|jgi:uncharacterized membrane protein|nr:MAG: hypothetical protein CH6_2279 [Candidatus Kapabacteria bacterium]ROL57455.1 MAG: DUF2231 domain-containing protein [Bacteroidetes/Chlorobi group bacterium Naka2016]